MAELPPGTAGRLARLHRLEPRPLYGPEGSLAYDDAVRHDRSEVARVLALARANGGKVLELACGAGRLTIPLVRRGHQVVALDNSPAMITLLGSRLSRFETPADAVLADMRTFELDERFGLVVIGTVSICLLDAEGRRRTFERVRRHLEPGGAFYLSTLEVDDRFARSGHAAERIMMVVGATSSTTIIQHFDGHRPVRTTALMRDDPVRGRSLFTGEVSVIGSAALAEELRTAGFASVEIEPVPAGEQVETGIVARVEKEEVALP